MLISDMWCLNPLVNKLQCRFAANFPCLMKFLALDSRQKEAPNCGCFSCVHSKLCIIALYQVEEPFAQHIICCMNLSGSWSPPTRWNVCKSACHWHPFAASNLHTEQSGIFLTLNEELTPAIPAPNGLRSHCTWSWCSGNLERCTGNLERWHGLGSAGHILNHPLNNTLPYLAPKLMYSLKIHTSPVPANHPSGRCWTWCWPWSGTSRPIHSAPIFWCNRCKPHSIYLKHSKTLALEKKPNQTKQ